MNTEKTVRDRVDIIPGLYVDTWSPGDGVTRYRFFASSERYFSGDPLYTAVGASEALTFIRGFEDGRES